MQHPFSDNYMTYDHKAHRYTLTEEYVLQVMNRNLSEVMAEHGEASDVANEPSILLDRVSRQIYSYALRCTATPNKRQREMALNLSLRDYIQEAMAEQLAYVMNNGDMSAYSGINLDTGMTVDPVRMRQAEIAPLARDALIRCGLASVVFRMGERDIDPDYEKEGY